MADVMFTFGIVLQIVFKYLNESPAALAEFYVDRDRTLIYKWLHDTAIPSKKLVPDIIRFIEDNSGEPTRVQIKADLDELIHNSRLDAALKDTLVNSAAFPEYLEGVITVAITQSKSAKSTLPLTGEQPEPAAVPVLSVSIFNIIYAALAALSGGIIWNLVNHAFVWPYFMGGADNEPSGLMAFV